MLHSVMEWVRGGNKINVVLLLANVAFVVASVLTPGPIAWLNVFVVVFMVFTMHLTYKAKRQVRNG